jgi:hypothetical protein
VQNPLVTYDTSLAPSKLKADQPLLATGIDSLITIELQHRLELGLQVYRLNPGLLSDLQSDQITSELSARHTGSARVAVQIGATRLSRGQRAFWYLQC